MADLTSKDLQGNPNPNPQNPNPQNPNLTPAQVEEAKQRGQHNNSAGELDPRNYPVDHTVQPAVNPGTQPDPNLPPVYVGHPGIPPVPSEDVKPGQIVSPGQVVAPADVVETSEVSSPTTSTPPVPGAAAAKDAQKVRAQQPQPRGDRNIDQVHPDPNINPNQKVI